MASLGPDEIKNLEQIRQRLQTLNGSFNALLATFLESQKLPAWASLQQHSGLISNNLQNLVQQLTGNQQLLASMVAYPLPQYPAGQAHLLEHLLRTKPEPEVKEWIEHGQHLAQDIPEGRNLGLSGADRDRLWQWAPVIANDEIRKQNWGGDYTMAEKQSGIDSVNTGLTRELHEPPDLEEADEDDGIDESDEEEADDDDPVQLHRRTNGIGLEPGQTTVPRPLPQMPIESIFRLMSTGSTSSGMPP